MEAPKGEPGMKSVRVGILMAAPWRRSFLRHLRHEINGLVGDHAGEVSRRTAASARRHVDEHRADLPDAQAMVVVTLAALVLAGFRTLVAGGVARPDAYEAVRKAFMATGATPFRWFLRGFLAVSRDPVTVASKPSYLRFAYAMFGRSFGFDLRTGPDRADLVVTRCAFHRFFVEHGEPVLNRIMCEWDHLLFDEMNASQRPIRMSRPATISTGCDECVFRHERTDGTGWKFVDIVIDHRLETLGLLADQADR